MRTSSFVSAHAADCSLAYVVIVVNYTVQDGRSNWLEGMILMCLYVMLAVVFWYYPGGSPPSHSTCGHDTDSRHRHKYFSIITVQLNSAELQPLHYLLGRMLVSTDYFTYTRVLALQVIDRIPYLGHDTRRQALSILHFITSSRKGCLAFSSEYICSLVPVRMQCESI